MKPAITTSNRPVTSFIHTFSFNYNAFSINISFVIYTPFTFLNLVGKVFSSFLAQYLHVFHCCFNFRTCMFHILFPVFSSCLRNFILFSALPVCLFLDSAHKRTNQFISNPEKLRVIEFKLGILKFCFDLMNILIRKNLDSTHYSEFLSILLT